MVDSWDMLGLCLIGFATLLAPKIPGLTIIYGSLGLEPLSIPKYFRLWR